MVRCPHCMNLTEAGTLCSHCRGALAYQAAPHQLPAGSILTDGAFRSFEIGAVKGQGGFGITYIALDLRRKARVALKEFYPSQCSQRTGMQVTAIAGMERVFAGGQSNFLQEARMLAALPPMDSVVQILDYFEVNGTAYIVMEYLDGTPLHRMVQTMGCIASEQLIPRLYQLLQNLKQLHEAGIVHRDISPDNIMWMSDGTMKLLDFGSARHLEDGKSVSIQLKHGFAPVEQYMTRGQGPYTDIYALCATIYYCLTGRVPPHAAQRLEQDDLHSFSQCGVALPAEWEQALLWGLQVQPKARPQTVDDLLRRMFVSGVPVVPSFRTEPSKETEQTEVLESIAQNNPKTECSTAAAADRKHQKQPAVFKNLAAKQILKDLQTKLQAIPAGTKLLSAFAAMIVVLLIVLIGVLSKDKQEAPAEALWETEPVLEQAVEQAPVEEIQPEPEPEEPQPLVTEEGLIVELVDGQAHIVGYDNSRMELEIPEMAFDHPVTTICTGAFRDETELMVVALPETVTWIQEDAFTNCTNLLALGTVAAEMTVRCDDAFAGCNALMLIFMEDGGVWEGNIPETAALLVEEMDSPIGPITDFEFSDSGCLYGFNHDYDAVLMKVPSHLTELDIKADMPEDNVIYMLDDAFSAAHDLTSLTLGDNTCYAYDRIDDLIMLDDFICDNTTLSCGWTFSCLLAYRMNLRYETDTVRPDLDLIRIAMERAEELTQLHELTRPDGSEWVTLLIENGYTDWTYGTNWINWSGKEDDVLFNLMESMMDDIEQECFDQDGELYTTVSCGVAEGTDRYHISWILTI